MSGTTAWDSVGDNIVGQCRGRLRGTAVRGIVAEGKSVVGGGDRTGGAARRAAAAAPPPAQRNGSRSPMRRVVRDSMHRSHRQAFFGGMIPGNGRKDNQSRK
eukprot:gene14811-biopygen3653